MDTFSLAEIQQLNHKAKLCVGRDSEGFGLERKVFIVIVELSIRRANLLLVLSTKAGLVSCVVGILPY